MDDSFVLRRGRTRNIAGGAGSTPAIRQVTYVAQSVERRDTSRAAQPAAAVIALSRPAGIKPGQHDLEEEEHP